jgi:glycosyltransferase involved in cell wall biosynthesis
MRLCCLCADPGVPWGGSKGASVHLAEIVGALAVEGAEVLVAVAAVEQGGPPPPRGVRLDLLPGPGKGSSVAERLAHEPARAAWLARRMELFGACALYERFALHSAAGSSAAAALAIPHLVELNAPLPDEAQRYRALDEPEAAARLEGIVLRRADLVLAVSSPLVAYARDRGARRVRLCPNAVDPVRFRPRLHRYGAAPVAVLAGTLRPWHGANVVARAWRLLGSRAPGLLVIGDGPDRDLLEQAGARVTGAVAHERVPKLLADADLGLVPYAADAPAYFSPLKLFEYLAAGLAVVAAELPGVSEVVDEDCAVLVPPGDPSALAAAVAALAVDASARARLGAAGRARVEVRHTWRRRARGVLGAAEELRPVEAVAR